MAPVRRGGRESVEEEEGGLVFKGGWVIYVCIFQTR